MSKIPAHILRMVGNKPWAIRPDAFQKIIQQASKDEFFAKEEIAKEKIVGQDYWRNSEAARSPIKLIDNRVAVIDVIGVIQPYSDLWSVYAFDYGMPYLSLERLSAQIDQVKAMRTVSTVIFYMDSPGGYITGCSEAAAQIASLKKDKKVITYGYGMICSGGYYLASASDLIIANKSAEIGSIGVMALFYDYKKMMQELGVEEITILYSKSPKKRPDPATEEGYAQIQQRIDDHGDIFTSEVAAYRNINQEDVFEKYGQGDVFVAGKAESQGMIDGVMTFDELLNEVVTNLRLSA